MTIENDAKPNCKNFATSYDEGHNMLFEEFDHAIYKHLAESGQCTHQQHMKQKFAMRTQKNKHVYG